MGCFCYFLHRATAPELPARSTGSIIAMDLVARASIRFQCGVSIASQPARHSFSRQSQRFRARAATRHRSACKRRSATRIAKGRTPRPRRATQGDHGRTSTILRHARRPLQPGDGVPPKTTCRSSSWTCPTRPSERRRPGRAADFTASLPAKNKNIERKGRAGCDGDFKNELQFKHDGGRRVVPTGRHGQKQTGSRFDRGQEALADAWKRQVLEVRSGFGGVTYSKGKGQARQRQGQGYGHGREALGPRARLGE